jgi:hypothetical protein
VKFRQQREAQKLDPVAPPAELAVEPAVQAYTLVFETKGPFARGRFVAPDGREERTEWRVRDHAMYAEIKLLYTKWLNGGVLGGFGRIPKAAERTR